MGAFSSFYGTGWNDVPKERSTRRAPAKRRPPRKSAVRTNGGQRADGSVPAGGNLSVSGNPSTEESITKHTALARGLVLKSWTGIVQGLIKKAKTGGYQQTKLLLDLCELTNADGSLLNEQRRQQLCDTLLEGLGLPSAQPEDEAAEPGPRPEPKTTGTL
jgi:hypothetical protein